MPEHSTAQRVGTSKERSQSRWAESLSLTGCERDRGLPHREAVSFSARKDALFADRGKPSGCLCDPYHVAQGTSSLAMPPARGEKTGADHYSNRRFGEASE